MDGKPLRSWRNKRKKSLYSEEAEAGFIFKKLPRVEDSEALPATQQTSEQKEAGLPLAGATKQASNKSLASNESLDVFEESLDVFEEDVGNKDIQKDIELKRFIAQLRKELLTAATESSESELDYALGLLAVDLRELYFEYLEAADDDDNEDSPQHSLEEELRSHIAQLKANIEMYKREIDEWEQVSKAMKLGAEQTRRDMEEERSMDFLNLRPEDTDILKTYLTPEQTQLLQQGSEVNLTFTAEWTMQLDVINSNLNKEMDRIQEYCRNVAQHTNTESLGKELILMRDSFLNPRPSKSETGFEHHAVEETPRTLFRALKNHV